MEPSFVPTEPLDLEDLRAKLIRQEETIIFSLIERAQFARNPTIYKPGGVFLPGINDQCLSSLSFLDFLFQETERVHALARRFTSPDENPFFPSALTKPVLPLLPYPQHIKPNNININNKILEVYISKILPAIASDTTDRQESFGSTATADIAALQAISKRIHMGKHVAEVKFQSGMQAQFVQAIKDKDIQKLSEFITHAEVEERLLKRVFVKASTYGQDIPRDATPNTDAQAEGSGKSKMTYKVLPSTIVEIYEQFIIPLTKHVEIEYLLQRLSAVEVCFLGPLGSVSSDAVHHFFGGLENVQPCLQPSIEKVFQAVLSGQALFGLVPYHDNGSGFVRETTTFLSTTNVKVYGDITVPVHFQLLSSKPLDLSQIETVYSHPLALQQCQHWLAKYLPHVQLIASSSTSYAAESIMDSSRPVTAVATPSAGKRNNLRVLADSIQDTSGHSCRFLVISKYYNRTPTGNDLTLVLFEVEHVAASLCTALSVFGKHNISLLSIESRPSSIQELKAKGNESSREMSSFEGADGLFRFLVELIGHAEEEHVKAALLELKQHAANVNVIGAFQRGSIVPTNAL